MSWPTIPEHLIDHGLLDNELGELWSDLVTELLDPEYYNRTHNKRTYDAGCRGPLCRKATRDAGRRRNRTGISEKYLYVDRILDHWCPIAQERILLARTRILEEMTA